MCRACALTGPAAASPNQGSEDETQDSAPVIVLNLEAQTACSLRDPSAGRGKRSGNRTPSYSFLVSADHQGSPSLVLVGGDNRDSLHGAEGNLSEDILRPRSPLRQGRGMKRQPCLDKCTLEMGVKAFSTIKGGAITLAWPSLQGKEG